MLEKLNQLTESQGALKPGHGLISGIIALSLGILCFLGVLAFHFPQYLTTPQLRQSYNVDVIRTVMLVALAISGGISLVNIIFGRARWLSAAAFLLVAVTALLGGHKVPVNDFADHTPYIGLDWFILDLLGSSLIFIFIEKLFPHRKNQPVFRPEWQTDFHHFIVNHMIVGFVLLATNLMVHKGLGWAVKSDLHAWIQSLPFVLELLLIILAADLVQYWTHRAYHETWLWRLHAVHHSTKHMDWMAGSRQHIVELLITRTLILGVIFVLGFSKEVIDAYIIVVGFQAVFNHCNVNVRLGPLRYLMSPGVSAFLCVRRLGVYPRRCALVGNARPFKAARALSTVARAWVGKPGFIVRSAPWQSAPHTESQTGSSPPSSAGKRAPSLP
jgi:sterol desaturase/sphingolipid hydroxylase (fatty acid hydroxylase superfamily)